MPENPKQFLQSLPHGERQRWVFTQHELRHPQECLGNDEFVAELGSDDDGPIASNGVIVLRNGTVTNQWSDGTAGVADEYKALADETDELVKPVYIGHNFAQNDDDVYASDWRDVLADEEGKFIEWADARSVIESEIR